MQEPLSSSLPAAWLLAMSNRSSTVNDGLAATWTSIRALLAASEAMDLPLLGQCRHFHVKLDGRVSRQGDDFLLPGPLLRGWALDAEPVLMGQSASVVIRMRAVDYYSVGKHCQTVRILHSTLTREDEMRVLDATYGTSVVAGLAHLRQDESVLLAELFCGSFNGWSQGAYVLRDMGYDVSVRWLLDQDPACIPAASLIHDGALQVAHNVEDLRRYVASACDVLAIADVADTWWHGLCALPGVAVWAASPPCQPWSTASWGLACHEVTVDSCYTFLLSLKSTSRLAWCTMVTLNPSGNP